MVEKKGAGHQQNNNTYAEQALYGYDAGGQRLRVDQMVPGSGGPQTQTFKEYSWFGGQLLAEKDQAGNWIDYVYAGSQKIARLSVNDPRLEVQGNAGSGSKWQWYDPGMLHGYTIRAGDKLSWRQFQSPTARGGIAIVTSTNGSSTWSIAGQNGNMSNSDPVTGTWDNRVIDLTPLAGGAITLMGVGLDQNTTGAATADFADISLVSTDGTVGQVFDGNPLTLSA